MNVQEALKQGLVRIAEYGCIGEHEEKRCPQVESSEEEFCHPCQANATLLKIENPEAYKLMQQGIIE